MTVPLLFRRGLERLTSYDTPKTVRVKDAWLVFTHYLLYAGVFAYIITAIVQEDLAYRETVIPAGTIRASLQQPWNYGVLPRPDYCSNIRLNCLFWNPAQISVPASPTYTQQLFLTTRALRYTSLSTQANPGCDNLFPVSRNCNPTFPSSLSYGAANTVAESQAVNSSDATVNADYFIANIEDMILSIEHTISDEKRPTLLLQSEFIPYMVESSYTSGDKIRVRDLLKIAGVDLDKNSPASTNERYRRTGVELVVNIRYTKERDHFTYDFEVTQNTGRNASIIETIYDPKENSYTYLERSGIQLTFHQYGFKKEFDFMGLLRNLVASVVLLQCASIIINVVFFHLFKGRRQEFDKVRYERAKYTSMGSLAMLANSMKGKNVSEKGQQKIVGSKVVPEDIAAVKRDSLKPNVDVAIPVHDLEKSTHGPLAPINPHTLSEQQQAIQQQEQQQQQHQEQQQQEQQQLQEQSQPVP